MNLAIDIGNTRVKTGVFDHNELVDTQTFDELNNEALQHMVDKYNVTHVIAASTGVSVDETLLTVPGMFVHFTSTTPVPVENLYRTPETLGRDRLAGVVAASWLFPETHVLVIDAGTCLTYDVIDDSGKYLGGNIAPGVDMRYQAMHHYTKRLPQVTRPDAVSLIGETTEEAIRNGGLMGILMEVAGYIEMLRRKYPDLNTLLTGGDAPYLSEHLHANLTLQPHLILIGLNQILQFNVAKYN